MIMTLLPTLIMCGCYSRDADFAVQNLSTAERQSMKGVSDEQ